jgi:hypothetical protein
MTHTIHGPSRRSDGPAAAAFRSFVKLAIFNVASGLELLRTGRSLAPQPADGV